MEQPQNTPSNSSCPPLVICPFCKKNFPSLSLKPSNGQMEIVLQCSCLKHEKTIFLREFLETLSNYKAEPYQCTQHRKEAKKYCTICQEWLCNYCLWIHDNLRKKDFLSHYLITLGCRKHRTPFSFYCQKCRVNACKKCKKDHDKRKHKMISLCIDNYQPKIEVINEILDYNKQLIDTFVQRIERTIFQPLQMKADIQAAYEANASINKDLIQLHLSLCQTGLAFRKYPTYELKQQLTFIIDIRKFALNECKSIEKEYKRLKKHLQTNYLLRPISNTYKSIVELDKHEQPVNCLIQLKDGRLASSANDYSFMIWNVDTYECVTKFKGKNEYMHLLQLHDGNIAAFSDNGPIRIWSPKFLLITSFKAFESKALSFIQLKDGRLVITGYDSQHIKLWNPSTLECATLVNDTVTGSSLLQLKDGRLATTGSNSAIRLWDTTKYEQVASLDGHSAPVKCLIQLKDKRLASSSWDNTIKVWDCSTAKCSATLSVNNLSQLLTELTGGIIAFCDEGNYVKIWDTSASKHSLFGKNCFANSALLLDDGRLAIVDTFQIELWNTESQELVETLPQHRCGCCPLFGLIQLKDGRFVSCVHSYHDASILIWNA